MSDKSADSALLRQAIAGDRGALSQLLFAHSDAIERHVSHLLSQNPSEALSVEDVLQQTFVRAALSIGGFQERTGSSFGAWLMTIAGNLVRDAQKRRRRERRGIVKDPLGGGDESAKQGLDQLAAETTSPSMCVHRGESIRRLREAMAQLPPDQREVIQRYYFQHQSLEQVAESMSRTKDTIRGMCYRARLGLRAALGHSSWFFST